MRKRLGMVAIYAVLVAPAELAAAPGAAKLVSKNSTLVEATSGVTYTKVTAAEPARYELGGPAKYQVDFRLNLPAQGAARPAAVLTIVAQGKPVKAYRITGNPGAGAWKTAGIKPSTSTGMYVEVDAATETWEFKVEGGEPHGAALLVIPAGASKTALAANAPVLRATAAAPAATPAVTAAATPAPGPAVATGGGAAKSSIAADFVLFTRVSAKRYDLAAPGIAIAAFKPLSGDLSLGASVGWRRHSGGRTAAEYRGRVLPEYVLDVDAVPIEALARFAFSRGTLAPYARVGLGLEYARSSHERADDVPRRTVENDWTPTASASIGVTRPIGRGTLAAALGMRFANHAFAAHDFDALHGTELTIGYLRPF